MISETIYSKRGDGSHRLLFPYGLALAQFPFFLYFLAFLVSHACALCLC